MASPRGTLPAAGGDRLRWPDAREGARAHGGRADAVTAVRVAVVQATPVVLDGPASVRKACRLIEEAGVGGARLISLPEGFVPIMPRSCWGHHAALIASPRSAALHRRIWEDRKSTRLNSSHLGISYAV